jgi:hypothetical protein
MVLSPDNRYYLKADGAAIPRVSTILSDTGLSCTWSHDEARAERGNNAHSWLELVLLDRLGQVPEEVAPLVLAIIEWRDRHRIVPMISSDGITPMVEYRVEYNGRYAGCLDLVDMSLVLWDAKFWASKASGPVFCAGAQTAAYAECVKKELQVRKIRRNVVWFHPVGESTDGKPLRYTHEVIPMDDPADWPTFSAACSVWWARKRHGLL